MGLLGNSSAMISDALHSASDVFSAIVVMIGIKMAAKESDKEHPYGHEKMECVAAILLAMVLFITGLGIGIEALKTIFFGRYEEVKVPGKMALIAAVISILVKESMYWYTRYYARKVQSGALMADAWHHRSDAMSSVGSLVGILGARHGAVVMDSVASLIIFVFIGKAAYDIFMDAIRKMIDHSCDEEIQQQIYDCILETEKVLGINMLRTRICGNQICVDAEIRLDEDTSLNEAHEISELVHQRIGENISKVKHIMVQVNPTHGC
jgi:cation diffusion facilitator family transporter